MTNKINTYGEFDLRSVQKWRARMSADATRPPQPVLARRATGHLQAEQAEQAEEFEKEFEFEYLADDLSHELKEMKNSVSTT